MTSFGVSPHGSLHYLTKITHHVQCFSSGTVLLNQVKTIGVINQHYSFIGMGSMSCNHGESGGIVNKNCNLQRTKCTTNCMFMMSWLMLNVSLDWIHDPKTHLPNGLMPDPRMQDSQLSTQLLKPISTLPEKDTINL